MNSNPKRLFPNAFPDSIRSDCILSLTGPRIESGLGGPANSRPVQDQLDDKSLRGFDSWAFSSRPWRLQIRNAFVPFRSNQTKSALLSRPEISTIYSEQGRVFGASRTFVAWQPGQLRIHIAYDPVRSRRRRKDLRYRGVTLTICNRLSGGCNLSPQNR
jgi:hypothetical protein